MRETVQERDRREKIKKQSESIQELITKARIQREIESDDKGAKRVINELVICLELALKADEVCRLAQKPEDRQLLRVARGALCGRCDYCEIHKDAEGGPKMVWVDKDGVAEACKFVECGLCNFVPSRLGGLVEPGAAYEDLEKALDNELKRLTTTLREKNSGSLRETHRERGETVHGSIKA